MHKRYTSILQGGVTVLQGFCPNGLNHLYPAGVESVSSNAQNKSTRYEFVRLSLSRAVRHIETQQMFVRREQVGLLSNYETP
jgi:hypothetical protein